MALSAGRVIAWGVCVVLSASACQSGSRTVVIRGAGATGLPPAQSTAEVGNYAHTPADVHFMSGMIPHHAQAILMAGWCGSHGTSSAVRVICERIVVAQRDEIATMREWLRDRKQPVPDSNATHLRMRMNGVEHDMLMPGMLNPEELAQLDRARGREFDRLFLTFMIRHHEGALSMVHELFGSPGAAQDEVVFKFASDVFADQTSEIEHMQKLLTTLPP